LRREFREGIRALPIELPPQLLDDLYSAMDVDMDGFIDVHEFLRCFRSASDGSGDSVDMQRERVRLEKRLHELKSTVGDAMPLEAIRQRESQHVASMQMLHAQQRAQYQATIAALQHQLATGPADPGPRGKQRVTAVGTAQELQAQVNDLRGFYSKKVRNLEDKSREAEARARAAAAKLQASREAWSHSKSRLMTRINFIESELSKNGGAAGEAERLQEALHEALAHGSWYQVSPPYLCYSRTNPWKPRKPRSSLETRLSCSNNWPSSSSSTSTSCRPLPTRESESESERHVFF
jgi:hypothetical protein